MNPRVQDGWMVVDCDASDHSQVEIAVLSGGLKAFAPAFRDYDGVQRVAKIRLSSVSGRVVVYTRIDGQEAIAGSMII